MYNLYLVVNDKNKEKFMPQRCWVPRHLPGPFTIVHYHYIRFTGVEGTAQSPGREDHHCRVPTELQNWRGTRQPDCTHWCAAAERLIEMLCVTGVCWLELSGTWGHSKRGPYDRWTCSSWHSAPNLKCSGWSLSIWRSSYRICAGSLVADGCHWKQIHVLPLQRLLYVVTEMSRLFWSRHTYSPCKYGPGQS